MPRNLLFRFISVQLLFFSTNLLEATSAPVAIRPFQALLFYVTRGTLTKPRLENLISLGVDINAQNNEGMDALRLASGIGKLGPVCLLLEYGADVNAPTEGAGATALIQAALGGYDDVVEALLEAGADPDVKLTDGRWKGLDAEGIAMKKGHTNTAKIIAQFKTQPKKRAAIAGRLIIEFAGRGDLNEISIHNFLGRGADIDARNANSLTALLLAAINGRLGSVRILLKWGADVDARGPNDVTALIAAAMYGHEKIAEALLNAGADPNAKANLAEWQGMDAESIARKQGFAGIAKLIAEAKKKPPEKINPSERRAKALLDYEILNGAFEGNLTEKTLIDLLRKGASIDAIDAVRERPALLIAAGNNHANAVRLLLKYGAKVNGKDMDGTTALMMAANAGSAEMVSELLKHNADISTCNKEGDTALSRAKKMGHKRIVKLLLDAEKQKFETLPETPLPVARELTIPEMRMMNDIHEGTLDEQKLKNYLDQGADINVQAEESLTALNTAIFVESPRIINLLLDHNADINLPNAQDGITPLMFAVLLDKPAAVRVLLERHANINAQDKEGQTAISIAVAKNLEHIVDMLLEQPDRLLFFSPESKKMLDAAFNKANPSIMRKIGALLGLPIKPKKSQAPAKEIAIQKEEPIQVMLENIKAIMLKKNLRAQDFHDVEKLLGQVAKEITTVHELTTKKSLEENIIEIRDTLKKIKDNFIKDQESKILDILKKNPSPTLVKAANKAVSEIEELQMPELASKIEELHKLIETWSKRPISVVTEMTEAEKKALQEQEKHKAQELVQRLDETLAKNNLTDAEQLLRDIKFARITDATLQKRIAGLQDQYKEQKADALQTQVEEALAKYKEKPSSARADTIRDIIKALAGLKIPERRDFINKVNQQLRVLEKELAIVPEKKGVSPTPAPEPQQLLFIFDPYNQLEPLPKDIKSRAEEALKELSLGHKDPSAIKLSYGEGLWRIRVGNYRIVYERLPKKDAVAIVMIDARKEVYEAEDEQLQKTREDYLIDINDWPTDKLLSDAEDLLKKTASVADAAKAEPLLELYRWQLRGYPADQEYLKSLLLSGKAAFKMNDLAKARERFKNLIPQSIDFPKIKKQAEASLAEVEKRLASFQAGRRITPPSPARISPTPQEDIVGMLRQQYQEARQLLVTDPEKATLGLEQFAKESQPYAKELTQERNGADTLLNNEPLFASAMDYLEEGEFDDAISSFNKYLKEVGDSVPKARKELILDKIEESKLGRTISKSKLKK